MMHAIVDIRLFIIVDVLLLFLKFRMTPFAMDYEPSYPSNEIICPFVFLEAYMKQAIVPFLFDQIIGGLLAYLQMLHDHCI